MRGTTRTVAVAAMSAVALLAAGCGSGDSEPEATTEAKTGGEITVRGCNPENPLVPSNTTETCGGNVIDAVFAKLVHYDAETAKPEMDVAESIETTDNQNFTIKLKSGWKFHDGTDIKAKNFVDAWNYAAYGPNAQSSGYFMEPIEGYGDLQCAGTANPDDPCEGFTPKAKEMSGLKVVDDLTFTVKTTLKVANFPVRVGYSAFSPLPDAFFADPEGFGDKPIGSGPYKLDSWTKEQSIELSKFADYAGDFGGKVDKITFKIYADPDAAYNDVIASNLDITDEIPASALIDDKYKSDLPDRNAQKETGVIQTVTVAPVKVDPNYADPKIRQAISMAIDRETIIEKIFNNTRVPPPAGSPRSSTATRPASVASTAPSTPRRPRPSSPRPAASRVTRSRCPTTPTPLTRSGPRPPATASSRPSVSSVSPPVSSTSRRSAPRSASAR
jgi:oligopeptide transport system substrate-binding protein